LVALWQKKPHEKMFVFDDMTDFDLRSVMACNYRKAI